MESVPCVAAAGIEPGVIVAEGIAPEEALAILAAAGPADVSPGLWRDVRAAALGPRHS